MERRDFLRWLSTPVLAAALPFDEVEGEQPKKLKKPKRTLDTMVEKGHEVIVRLANEGRIPYQEMIDTINKYENYIRKTAEKNGIPGYASLGVAFLENGGGVDKTSGNGCCRGIYQLSADVAKQHGLIVNRRKDERKNPRKNIDAGNQHLKYLYDYYGDLYLAVQAFHSGIGNVNDGIKYHLKETKGKWLDIDRERLAKEKVKWIQMMQSDSAYKHFESLNDQAELYVPKTLAGWHLYRDRNKNVARK